MLSGLEIFSIINQQSTIINPKGHGDTETRRHRDGETELRKMGRFRIVDCRLRIEKRLSASENGL
jgi:hypothetical protein